MVSINTNLSSIIVQKSLTNSTNALNLAIERMTTGFKINHASDNAANYSIAQDMASKLSSFDIATENISMGIDMVNTAEDSISLMQSHAQRIMDLWTQAQNGTYSETSLQAIQAEVDSRLEEITRIYENTEYNGIKLFEGISLPDWAKRVQSSAGKPATSGTDERISDSEVNELTHVAGLSNFNGGSTFAISTVDDLANLAELVNDGVDTTGKTFIMGANLDLSEYCASHMVDGVGGWNPIGNDFSHGFKGTFNGNGHTISNLTINRPNADGQGLFGYTSGTSTIMNVGLEGVNVTGEGYVGGLVGFSFGCIASSYSTGTVTGDSQVGGLVGYSAGSIESSYSTGSVSGQYSIGGLVGALDGSIESSYSTGTVSGEGGVGGLVGYSELGSYIESSYSTGGVNGEKFAELYDPDGESSEAEIQEISLQVGISGDSSSNITFSMGLDVGLSISDISETSVYETLQSFMSQLSTRATELGAITNRLDSALESTTVSMENLTSSLSTIRDADIAKISSEYIRQQILQQASATLLATANQTPSIALQLL